ncbi:MAG: putative Ig domain-containing protein [Imperialibacter sp.]|uniref:putative Ig domain-containing protein n=1 Tax=Imperialibacter sp. TaxID=2038411 RepID=UPI0032EBD4F7
MIRIRNIAICTFLLVMLGMDQNYAQQSTTSTGGTLTGSGGIVSDAVGLSIYTSISGVGGKANEGIVVPVNFSPQLASIGAKSIDEEIELIFTAVGSDVDLQALDYSLDATSTGKGMSINPTTGVFSWTPAEDQDGSHSVLISVSDGTFSISETFMITVADINKAPVLAALTSKAVDELVPLSFTVSATDADLPAQALSYSLDATSLGHGMTIDASTGIFSWTPSESQDGQYTVDVVVSDGVATDVETITITVANINVAPVLQTIGEKSVDELVSLAFTVAATDSDLPAQALTYSLDQPSLDKGMTINASTGAFSWTPSETQDGDHDVIFTVSDGLVADSETITVAVADVNVAPMLGVIGAKSVDELLTLSFTAAATDTDVPVQVLTFSLDQPSLDAGMALDAATGAFSWTPGESQDGTYTVIFTVSDGLVTDSETITITVNDIPDNPLAFEPTSADITPGTFKASWGAVAGATEYQLEVTSNDFVNLLPGYNPFVLTTTEVVVTGLQATTGYQFRVRAKSALGVSGYSNIVSVTTSNDATSSALTIGTLTFENRQVNTTSQTLNISVTGGAAPYVVIASHRGLLQSEYTTATLTEITPGNYSFTVSPEMLDEMGVQFEITATDAKNDKQSRAGSIARSFGEAASPALPFERFGGTTLTWNLFTIPYDLDNKLVSNIFADLDQSRHEFDWRIVRYRNSTNDYVNFNTGQVRVGEAYWFNSKTAVSINVGAGQTTASIPFSMSLLKGWNLIGNPYTVPISWEQVLADNPDKTGIDPIRLFNGTALVIGDVVQPFSGGFVFAEEATSVDIDPIASKPNGRILAGKGRIESTDIDEMAWLFPLQLSDGQTTTVLGGVGMHPDALELKDQFDGMVPPRFIHYSEMYTTHQAYFYPYFATDVVPTKGDHTWNFTLSSNKVVGPTNLTWDMGALQNKASGLYLLDQQSGKLVDMKTTNSHTVDLTKGDFKFEVYFVSGGDQVIPHRLLLGDAYPNPASTQATIPVLLPGDANELVDIDLSVFDINGNRISTLASGKYKPGVYEFTWNAGVEQKRSVSGMFFYRLSFNDNNRAPLYKKLILR